MQHATVKNTVNKRNRNGQFAKGNQEGNRRGRPPKQLAIADILRTLLDETEAGQSKRERILSKVVALALAGERWAVEFIADRTEGKPVNHIQSDTSNDIIMIE